MRDINYEAIGVMFIVSILSFLFIYHEGKILFSIIFSLSLFIITSIIIYFTSEVKEEICQDKQE